MESIIAEYTRVARNYYKDALTLNKATYSVRCGTSQTDSFLR